MVKEVSEIVSVRETNNLKTVSETQKVTKEENLSEILAGNNECKKETTVTKPENEETKSFFERHKVLSTIGIIWSGLAVGAILYAIGRNPVKAAKFLKGNSIIPKGSAFEKSEKIADGIFKKHPEITEKALNLFKKPDYPTQMSKSLAELEKFLQAEKVPETHEVSKAVSSLKKKIEEYVNQIRKKAMAGVRIDFKESEKFSETVSPELDEIVKYLKTVERDWEKISKWSFRSYDFKPVVAGYGFDVTQHIAKCPEEFLNGRTLYHGSIIPRNIYKKGFNPFYGRQVRAHQARELGAGVYFTPDSKVANQFTMQLGGIIPVQLSKDAKIAIVTEEIHSSLSFKISELLLAEYGEQGFKKLPLAEQSAIQESLTRKLFQMAGYDGIYTPKAMRSGGIVDLLFAPDVNKVFGRNQSQVAVFNPEQTEILSRNLFQRIKDVKDNICTAWHQMRNITKGQC